jgi:L-asparaginase/Glu-tRNA(Gln) amidotransferase subunit D
VGGLSAIPVNATQRASLTKDVTAVVLVAVGFGHVAPKLILELTVSDFWVALYSRAFGGVWRGAYKVASQN